MTISELITRLEGIRAAEGDLPVCSLNKAEDIVFADTNVFTVDRYDYVDRETSLTVGDKYVLI